MDTRNKSGHDEKRAGTPGADPSLDSAEPLEIRLRIASMQGPVPLCPNAPLRQAQGRLLRHARTCSGHLSPPLRPAVWMPGTSPGMTRRGRGNALDPVSIRPDANSQTDTYTSGLSFGFIGRLRPHIVAPDPDPGPIPERRGAHSRPLQGGRPRQRSVCAAEAGREGRRWAPDRGPGRPPLSRGQTVGTDPQSVPVHDRWY